MKHLKNKISSALLLSIVLLSMFCCRTAKQSAPTQPAEPAFQTFTAALQFEYQPEPEAKRQSINGQIRIVHNSAIQISLRLPIVNSEVARINVTPSDFTFIDRRNKIYAVGSTNDLRLLLHSDHNFASLQKLFTTQQVIHFSEDNSKTDFYITKPTFDKDFTIDESIPPKYRQISVEQLINALNNTSQ